MSILSIVSKSVIRNIEINGASMMNRANDDNEYIVTANNSIFLKSKFIRHFTKIKGFIQYFMTMPPEYLFTRIT